MGQPPSKHPTGYRAWSRPVLETLPLKTASDDFVFDNQTIAQTAMAGFRIREISCPTKYFAEASSINFRRSSIYGMGVLATSAQYRLARRGLARPEIFPRDESARLPAGVDMAAVETV